MHILHVNFGILQGGIDNLLNDMMNCQLKLGHQVSLLVINNVFNDYVKNLFPEGIGLYALGRPVSSKNPYYMLKAYWIINYIIRPDVIHCHNGDLGFFLMLDKHPKILTVHAMHLPTFRYKYFNYICCISQAVMDDVKKTYLSNSMSVVYNSVNSSLIKKKKNYELNHKLKIIQVGRLNHIDKGQDISIRAVKILKNQDVEVQLTIVGDGKSKKYLQHEVKLSGLQNSVIFMGEKSREWIYNHLCEYDVMVVPSRHEGFGLAIIEGIFAGLPVVVSDIDGPKEITEDGTYCYIFNSEDENKLAGKIMEIYQTSPEIVENKIEKDIQHFKEKYSCEVMVESYVNIYKSVIHS